MFPVQVGDNASASLAGNTTLCRSDTKELAQNTRRRCRRHSAGRDCVRRRWKFPARRTRAYEPSSGEFVTYTGGIGSCSSSHGTDSNGRRDRIADPDRDTQSRAHGCRADPDTVDNAISIADPDRNADPYAHAYTVAHHSRREKGRDLEQHCSSLRSKRRRHHGGQRPTTPGPDPRWATASNPMTHRGS